MPSLTFVFTIFAATLSLPIHSFAADSDADRKGDACAKISGKAYVAPADARACLESFAFNETLRTNVMDNADKVFNFFTFEDYYLNSPPPYEALTKDIRAELSRIRSAKYDNDYAFNKDLHDMVNSLNDGHTLWTSLCYQTFQNILPAPIVSLEENGTQNVYVVPDSVEFLNLLGDEFTSYLDKQKFDWKRLAGAKVLAINSGDPYAYIDHIADTVSGNYLDHGIRVNSVFSSYRISNVSYSQRLGDLGGPPFPTLDSLTYSLIAANASKPENVTVPYVAAYAGAAFKDKKSYWSNNCVATNTTNGVDNKGRQGELPTRRRAIASIREKGPKTLVGLPEPYQPTLKPLKGSDHVVKSYMLDKDTGVMFVGSFEPDDYEGFQTDVDATMKEFEKKGASKLIIDLTNNGGGYVCLGVFLHQYLAGSDFGYAGFQSTSRANPLAQKILASSIKLGLNSSLSFYAADNWAYLNDTQMPTTYDYNDPSSPLTINGKSDPTSQRFHDVCTPYNVKVPKKPYFKPSNIAIVGNGNCASTCAMFSTLMYEQHNTTVAIFGGKPGEDVQYRGMAGNQVLEWTDLDSEIKTADLKHDSLAPPDLLVNGGFRHNWRTAWSWLDEKTPIAYRSELPKYRFAYNKDTYNNPENLWKFAASKIFG